ncbi:iron-sulfur cluster assembly scaffold protein [Hydrogenimonas urashimensis]|uniref:iron-sulfur cluster assembly scaffold protein n=1 Tax=Hydrogenimonas urashimensis TaxID=2740515 RepID=UPI0019150C69|nr:iron-sulfur cluster assembly scaffold protein [Hydrogenimonas urashimensis]
MEKKELYDITMDHMMNPRNYGKLEDADGQGIGKNPDNGEMVIVYLKMDDGKIEDIRFQAKACMTTIIAGSIFTETVKGATIAESKELAQIMLGKLDSMPPEEAACSEMVAQAFLAALDQYEAKKSDPDALVPTHMIGRACALPEEEKQ